METPMRYLLVLLLVVAGLPAPALCQSPPSPLARADFTATIGSFSARRADAPDYDPWTHSRFAGIGAGYYWTDHLKTEIELSSGGRARTYGTEPAGVPESPLSSIHLEHVYRSLAVSVAQSYQFGRNAYFHPFVAAGLDVERVRHEIDRPAQTVLVYPGRGLTPPSFIVAGRIEVPALTRSETAVTAAPYAAAGFKAYFTERSFFRTDLKVSARSRIDRVIWRAGFGVDF
jgi:hypothetical protein